jgi:ABC-type polysaccharide/polyol phosphate transport system ATPase subunit
MLTASEKRKTEAGRGRLAAATLAPVEAAAKQAVISLESVRVVYRVPHERIRSVKEYAIRLLKGGVPEGELHALKGVSLDVKGGEIFGIVGHNGAGKSTLLRVIARVIRPRSGRVVVKGRVAPLLELGAGFHPELTGRENVFLNGTLLGHSEAALRGRMREIVEFAELRDFIDAPLRTYSSGMVARLGFAVATAFRPDVLLLDEVLAVGDERFQQKCLARIEEFKRQGVTFLVVAHSAGLLRTMCDRLLWLDHGTVRAVGEAARVADSYREFNHRAD